jgi:hypothetical protein
MSGSFGGRKGWRVEAGRRSSGSFDPSLRSSLSDDSVKQTTARTGNGKGQYGEMIMQLAPAHTPQGPKSSGCVGVALSAGLSALDFRLPSQHGARRWRFCGPA